MMTRLGTQTAMSLAVTLSVPSCLLRGAAHGQASADDDSYPGPSSGTQGDHNCSIQDAIDAVVGFDAILVRPGADFKTIDSLGQGTDPHRSNWQDVTKIDAGSAGTVVSCINGEGRDTIPDGFTITSADAPFGGGVQQCRPTADGDQPRVLGNTADMGGGICNFNSSSPAVTKCLFSGNSAALAGGGC